MEMKNPPPMMTEKMPTTKPPTRSSAVSRVSSQGASALIHERSITVLHPDAHVFLENPSATENADCHDHAWSTVKGSRSPPWSFVVPRACAVAAFVRPRFGTAPVEWDLAIVDPLLVARLDAKSLLGSAGRLVVALIRIVVVVALDRGLLRARRERPRRRAAEQRDERAALHSITSSASESRLSEILMPSAFAVLRLITVSNLLTCMTGRSAGFSPLRTRPT